jgi:C-terminal processing protease CtpA/Prc
MIDLRGTTGGDPWPMLAGLGPLLGPGVVGFSTEGEGRTIPWGYANGMLSSGDSVVAAVFPPYELSRSEPPVAVLTGPRTSGAGEAVLVAFRGRSNTRSFGEATGGSPRVTETVPLGDGAVLSLETEGFADRTGRTYAGSIAPDVTMAGTGDPANTQPFIAATVWLSSQPECRRR